jgi:uncharacterized protein (TIGR03435 family)
MLSGMRRRCIAAVLASSSIALAHLSARAPQAGPTFDAVSIKRTGVASPGVVWLERPGGSLTASNVSLDLLVSQAYQLRTPHDLVGLPEWASSDRWDVNAISSLAGTTKEERMAMVRAMLSDRFKLIVHVEKREQPAYDLLLVRGDGSLGPNLTPTKNDCVRILAEREAAREAAANSGAPSRSVELSDSDAPPLCTARLHIGRPPVRRDTVEADTTMADLAFQLDILALRRVVVDKTGLAGTYRMTMTYDRSASLKGPDFVQAPDRPPTIFTAIRDQLGLRLEPSTAVRDTLIVDRVERPMEN